MDTKCPSKTLGDPVTGSRVQTCLFCRRAVRDTRETISNGLRLIRIRFGLPNSELPDLSSSELNKYLSYLLLSGKKRASVAFPRSQRAPDATGLVCLSRMCLRDRWNFSHSVASIKRNLPAGCSKHTPSVRDAWEASAFSTPPPLSPGYVAFARKVTSRIFYRGWDRNYERFVAGHIPNATARMNCPRADLHWAKVGAKEFSRQCLTGRSVPDIPVRARYKEVMSAGKVRPLVIYDENVEVLGPLHKLIYSHLSSFPWLLVGPPTREKISSVCVYPHMTSIDLVSATDNLSLEVTEAILAAVFSKSRLPGPIRLRAFRSLYPLIDCGKEVKEVSHGQMMGSYLSFPLLCLHSYIAASWALRNREGKVLVNGDDTLISSSSFVESSDYPLGYKLNDMKTIRSKNVAEINSTAFLRGKGGRWREVRHLRRGGFLTDYAGMLHASSAVAGDVGWTDAFIRSRIGKKWGFLPSQLGLHPRSYPAFCKERSMSNRYYTGLPCPPGEDSTLLQAVRRRLDPDEALAMKLHLFNNGREGGRKRDVFCPSKGEVWKTYGHRSVSRYYSTFLGRLASLKLRGRKEDKLMFLPADYVSMREDLAIRSLKGLVIE